MDCRLCLCNLDPLACYLNTNILLRRLRFQIDINCQSFSLGDLKQNIHQGRLRAFLYVLSNMFVMWKGSNVAMVWRIVISKNVGVLPIHVLISIFYLRRLIRILYLDKLKSIPINEQQRAADVSLLGIVSLLDKRRSLNIRKALDRLFKL